MCENTQMEGRTALSNVTRKRTTYRRVSPLTDGSSCAVCARAFRYTGAEAPALSDSNRSSLDLIAWT